MNTGIQQGLGVGLSTTAGFVDSLGYLSLGGLFVAFMSGNSTVLGVSAVAGMEERTVLAGEVVGLFVAGVMIGTWVGRPFADKRPPVVLLLMAAVLAAAAGLHRLGLTVPCCLVVSLAMGIENTVFQRGGAAGIGLTYMTGTLVRLGQKIAEAIIGGPWRTIVIDLLLWAGMVVGAVLGTAVYVRLGLDGLWIAVAAVVAMAGVAFWEQRSR